MCVFHCHVAEIYDPCIYNCCLSLICFASEHEEEEKIRPKTKIKFDHNFFLRGGNFGVTFCHRRFMGENFRKQKL